MRHKPFLWLRTVRHFSLSALGHRLRLKISRKFYRPCLVPEVLSLQWQAYTDNVQFASENAFLSFGRWQYQAMLNFKASQQQRAEQLIQQQQAGLLNEHFLLFQNMGDLSEALAGHTPLWQENYGYLEFLLPLIWFLQSEPKSAPPYMLVQNVLETQLNLFWQLSFKSRVWSTYGVSRRLLVYCELLPFLTQLSPSSQSTFWTNFYQESRYLVSFLEWDIQGNHLIQNLTAWLAVTHVFSQLPATHNLALSWKLALQKLIPQVFSKQILPDGFHYERTPMYHLWVLRDLLECLAQFKSWEIPDTAQDVLAKLAKRMLNAGTSMLHSSGQIPLFGDASLPQTPDFTALAQYARDVAGLALPEEHSSLPFQAFHQAGFAVFRNDTPKASLIIDCGDFAPRNLPAHAHCDMASFELHGANGPLIVDAGVSEYIPSLLRDYFRGTAAHNTVWFPGKEQAEIWGGFRVAEYPHFKGCKIETDQPINLQCNEPKNDAQTEVKLTISYENYNHQYSHQRVVRHMAKRLWVIEDRVQSCAAGQADCWSLLHIHPDCSIESQDGAFIVDAQLLIIPFGAQSVECSNQAPWRNHLNLYSAGFNLAQPGQLLALSPNLNHTFGWVLIPYSNQIKPHWYWQNELLNMEFPSENMRFAFKVTPEGLHSVAPTLAP